MRVYAMLLFGVLSICCMLPFYQSKEIDKNDQIQGYYWRDYNGRIPRDALAAGYSSKNETTYIGQVLHKDMLIPGEINDSDKRIYYESGLKVFEATENVKILCTKHPQLLRWIATTKDDFKKLVNKSLVPGGYEPSNKIFIGRKHVDDMVIVGKVQVDILDLDAVFHYIYYEELFFSYTFEITYLPLHYNRTVTVYSV